MQDNEVEMHLTHNEWRSVVNERIIMYAFNIKIVSIDKLDHIVNEYNKT